jgi:hypothetical protein
MPVTAIFLVLIQQLNPGREPGLLNFPASQTVQMIPVRPYLPRYPPQ